MAKHTPKKTDKASPQDLYQGSPRANFFKRLGAYVYDLFAIFALLMLATATAVIIVASSVKMGLMDLANYQDVGDYLAHNTLFAAFLAIVAIAFYGYFWSKGGQTIGMKAWSLRVQNSDGSNINFTQALIRMATSALGLGNFSALFQNSNAFQDLWAECEVIVLTKELNKLKGFNGKADQDKKQ